MNQSGPPHPDFPASSSGRESWSTALKKSDRRSTDTQSIISMMLDPSKRVGSTSRRGRQELSKEQDQNLSQQRDSFESTARAKRGTMDSIMSKYEHKEPRDGTQRWVQWQREAELEIERSKMSWNDTVASRAAIESE